LAIFGGADTKIPSEQAIQFQEALNKTNVKHRVVVLPRADHGFFDRRANQFPEQASQAWAEVMAHIATYVPPVAQVVPKRSGVRQARHGENEHFTGTAWLAELQGEEQADGANIYRVFFEPGARTAWHRHPGGQVLSVITGRGRVGNEEGIEHIEPGDLIYTKPNQRHWHGATPNSLVVHLAINTGNGDTNWEEKVNEDRKENQQ
jgi:quercetin dioxygenase-like cupin family protein